MGFIAQINLAQFPMTAVHPSYPATGIIHLFYPCDEDVLFSDEFLLETYPEDQNAVLYTSDCSNLTRIEADPAVLTFSSCEVKIRFENTIPDMMRIEEDQLFEDDKDAYVRYLKFCSSYSELTDSSIGFRFLGYLDGLQYGSQEVGTELLFQADSNEEIGMKWDLAGLLYFYISREDLLNRSFDAVYTDRVGT
ncbi:hypothetical protein PCCS19_35690 [Paenibacillus sp. CCS19]|uniref:DUF1963 domain-containing protein n=1 Tax=Paenibacillus sp. CCS19 TaxID=3158387 RepID=UPI00256330BC|nr:DUF1963 domain-containing protein [Paenibacillus cellulosilyticus]GMK40513.1 hypothetical protein PCCS19_35690 [Paenibacillus cellulosilyticus]